MMAFDSRPETREHIRQVRHLIYEVCDDLKRRAFDHDRSKLVDPERSMFDYFTPRLRGLTYGSDEYEKTLVEMGPALEHHYAVNDHHPQHFLPGPAHETDVAVETRFHEPGGEQYTWASAHCSGCDWTSDGDEADVRDAASSHEDEHNKPHGVRAMNLIQLIEMLADWRAATLRHDDGNLGLSIVHNQERFGMSDELTELLHRTAAAMGWL